IKAFIRFMAVIISMIHVIKWKLGFNYKDVAISTSLIKGKLGYAVRREFYNKTLLECGNDLTVHFGAYIVYPNTKIGKRCTIEEYSVLSLADVGDDVIIASNVIILSGSNHHEIDNLAIKFHDSVINMNGVTLGNNIWIGAGAVVMANVPSGSVIGAGSVVNKNLYIENAVYAGVPAKFIRRRGEL
ncbi:TPA: acyltransferase, partial [Vibrio cholerae]